MAIRIERVENNFEDWQSLLNLLQSAFEYQHTRINPPSSLNLLTLDNIAEKSVSEILLLAYRGQELVGCAFLRELPHALYVGKLAVLPSVQGEGVGKKLLNFAQEIACQLAYSQLELQVRIELIENQAVFSAMGFVKSGETSHPDFNRPTSITMQKNL